MKYLKTMGLFDLWIMCTGPVVQRSVIHNLTIQVETSTDRHFSLSYPLWMISSELILNVSACLSKNGFWDLARVQIQVQGCCIYNSISLVKDKFLKYMYELLKMHRPFHYFISGIRNFKINTSPKNWNVNFKLNERNKNNRFIWQAI